MKSFVFNLRAVRKSINQKSSVFLSKNTQAFNFKRNLYSFLFIVIIILATSCKKEAITTTTTDAITSNTISDITTVSSQITDKTVFPLNDYLSTTSTSPYPVVNNSKINAIDKSKFVNVMNYGAKGDGKTFDDEAIAKAFSAAQYGVIFPSGKTFLVSKLSEIRLSKNITVYAYGAAIKMADNKRYSALEFDYPTGSKTKNFIWLGGTFDGNKDHQSWPGSPTGNNTWAESHGRFIGVSYAQFVLFKDVTVLNTVVDGIGLERNRIGVITDCNASGGARIQYSENAEQGTYFKCTRAESRAFYCNNLDCEGGSIGVHYSTANNTTSDSSVTTIINSHFKNQSQNPVHFEDCRRIFLYNCTRKRFK